LAKTTFENSLGDFVEIALEYFDSEFASSFWFEIADQGEEPKLK